MLTAGNTKIRTNIEREKRNKRTGNKKKIL